MIMKLAAPFKENELLLEKAKQAVELAIEQGEAVAIAFLGEVA
jgi:hypothetical protein